MGWPLGIFSDAITLISTLANFSIKLALSIRTDAFPGIHNCMHSLGDKPLVLRKFLTSDTNNNGSIGKDDEDSLALGYSLITKGFAGFP